ncbi:DUF2141 domain-containing protein [Pontibacter sp. SGAir0037]|uniref:DUF2141 domain-containing protein n=1 Tax=Pontibacter sp. SGAir0037 TaxID=2571030 RepID=UPI0010CCF3CB|nr:DUF2141 domain-containing protein [Pontibacter sp. SGAir0037]QCR21997.1 hypothetical protein C1N53_06365 [Pontibacter sp. SGAir0037]
MTSVLSFLLLLTSSFLYLQPAPQFSGTMVIELSNLPADKSGTVYIGIYNKAADFPEKGKAAYNAKVKVTKQDKAVAKIENATFGEYAIALFYDTNNNGTIDTNFLGIPKEPYGFSNSLYHATRATSFEEAKFSFTQNSSAVKIKLKN